MQSARGYRTVWEKLAGLERLWIALLAIVAGLLVGVGFILWTGKDPILAYKALFSASFSQWRDVGEALVSITPLIFTGLAVAVAFRTGLFNIGVEGQFIVGEMAAAVAGYMFNLPAPLHILLVLFTGAMFGGLWAAVPAILKAKLGAHEVINTIMMNYIALYLTHYLVTGPLNGHAYLPVTKTISNTAKLWRFIPGSRANVGIFIAVIMAAFVYYFLWKTKTGYECRAVGLNPDAAEYGGINVPRNMVISMMVSGALAGMGGAVQIMGIHFKFYDHFAFTGYGFDGIAVSLLGNNHPLGVLAGASLFGILARGSQRMQSVADVPREIIGVVQAAIIIFIAADQIIRRIIYYRRRRDAVDTGAAKAAGGEM